TLATDAPCQGRVICQDVVIDPVMARRKVATKFTGWCCAAVDIARRCHRHVVVAVDTVKTDNALVNEVLGTALRRAGTITGIRYYVALEENAGRGPHFIAATVFTVE